MPNPPAAASAGLFGRRLREERLRHSLTLEQLAERCDPPMRPQVLSRLEHGEGDPKLSTIGRLADALGVEPAALITNDRAN